MQQDQTSAAAAGNHPRRKGQKERERRARGKQWDTAHIDPGRLCIYENNWTSSQPAGLMAMSDAAAAASNVSAKLLDDLVNIIGSEMVKGAKKKQPTNNGRV
jgi:hypothetical protein